MPGSVSGSVANSVRDMRASRMYAPGVMTYIDVMCSAMCESMPEVSQNGRRNKVHQSNQKAGYE